MIRVHLVVHHLAAPMPFVENKMVLEHALVFQNILVIPMKDVDLNAY